jgi:transposase
VRATTAFNRLLRLPGAWVIDVSFGAEGVIVTVALRRRRRVCSGCGQVGGQIHGRRVKRWRHLDLGSCRCVIECELRRLWCRDCGVRFEAVPWARSGSRYTRDFEDVTAWLAQQMAKKPIAGLLRIAWDTVGRIVERVVADHLDERRLQGLVAIGVDEISYRRHHRYLTSVVDHRSGAIVWCSPGRNAETLREFFDLLGERKESIRAVSIDMSGGYEKAIREAIPQAEVAFDPFQSCAWPSARSTRSAAMSGTPTSARTPRPAGGSRAPAGRC